MSDSGKTKKGWSYPVDKATVCDSSVSACGRLLFIILKSFVGPTCEFPWPSQDHLARLMGMHRASVQRHLKELIVVGWISRTERREKGKFKSYIYTLNK